VLFVGNGRDDHLPVDAGAARVAARDQGRGEAALHVVGAAPDQPVAVDPGLQRALHRAKADRVQVPAEHQGRPIASTRLRTITFGRPSAEGIVSAVRPFSTAQAVTNRAISPSPASPARASG